MQKKAARNGIAPESEGKQEQGSSTANSKKKGTLLRRATVSYTTSGNPLGSGGPLGKGYVSTL